MGPDAKRNDLIEIYTLQVRRKKSGTVKPLLATSVYIHEKSEEKHPWIEMWKADKGCPDCYVPEPATHQTPNRSIPNNKSGLETSRHKISHADQTKLIDAQHHYD